MAGSIKRRTQSGVNLVREIERAATSRRSSPCCILQMSETITFASEEIGADLVRVNERDSESIEQGVRTAIATQIRGGIRTDSSGLGAINDGVSRMICERQVPVIERLHVYAAVMRGVEAGLRDLARMQVSGPKEGGVSKKHKGEEMRPNPDAEHEYGAPISDAHEEIREASNRSEGRQTHVPLSSRGNNSGRMQITPDTEDL